MFNRNKLVLLLLFVTLGSYSKAQNVTSTPYSQFGLGQLQKNNSVISLGLGGIANGLRLDNAINTQNPASYSALQWTTFEVGAFGSFLKLENSTGSAFRNNAALSYLKIAFPISPKWGASFGLVPVSGMGYESNIKSTFLDTPVTQIFKGEGGLNQFYLGTAYNVTKNLSIGVNASYLFGTLDRTKANEFPDSTGFLNVKQTNSTYIGSLFFNYGIQYKLNLLNNKYLIIGLNGNPTTNLSSTRNTISTRYYYQNDIERAIDTTQNTVDQKGTVVYPMINSLGFSYGKVNHWMFGSDVTLGNWSTLSIFDTKQNLSNTFDFNLGGAITPDYMAVGNYFKNIEYRFGFNYNKSYVNIAGEDINQMSLSLGFGLPLPKTASRINLAFEIGQRGTTNSGLIKEQFMGVHAGFNFCDKWFIQRKYD
jgi:hypothetical protein